MSRVCLDLFAGLGGFSAAFEDAEGWEVVTVDINPDFDPDICADILELDWSDLPEADIVLASPPCPAFSPGGGHTDTRLHELSESRYFDDKLVMPDSDTGHDSLIWANYGRALAEARARPWYVIENPKGGLRNFWGEPDYHVWYCQYNGEQRAKPTDLWGRLPNTFTPLSCSRQPNPFCDHDPASRGTTEGGTQDSNLSSAERAKVPYRLSKTILEAVEAADRSIQDDTEQAALADGGFTQDAEGGNP